MHRWGATRDDNAIEITFRAGVDEAKALLWFLRCILAVEIMHALDNRVDEVKAFTAVTKSSNAAASPSITQRCLLH